MKIERFDDLSEVEQHSLVTILRTCFPFTQIAPTFPKEIQPLLRIAMPATTATIAKDWYGKKFHIDRIGEKEDKRHKVIGLNEDGTEMGCLLECDPMPEEMKIEK